jgi:hypothetical protein
MDSFVSFTEVPEFINHSNQSLDYTNHRNHKSKVLYMQKDYDVKIKFSLKLDCRDLVDWVIFV